MSPLEFNLYISELKASYNDRKYGADIIHACPELLPVLLERCFNTTDKEHYKALWILEFYARIHLSSLQNSIPFILLNIPKIKHDSGIRPLAKILQYCLTEFDKDNFSFTTEEMETITEICFDWLISDQKVAVKSYAIDNLYILGKNIEWIYPELTIIIEKDKTVHSAFYEITANKILKKIAQIKKIEEISGL